MKRILLIVCALIQVSCVSAYKAGAGESTANVRFLITTNSGMGVKIWVNDCESKNLSEIKPDPSPQKTNAPAASNASNVVAPNLADSKAPYADVKITAGKHFAGYVSSFYYVGTKKYSCDAPISFIPEKDKNYEIHYIYSNSSCLSTNSEIIVADGKSSVKLTPNIPAPHLCLTPWIEENLKRRLAILKS